MDCHKFSDSEIVEKALSDIDFFKCIVDNYSVKFMRYIRRLTGLPPSDCEEIIQESFFKIYKNLNAYDPKLKFSSWIYRITHNEAISYLRKNNKKDTPVAIISEEEENKLFSLVPELKNKNDLLEDAQFIHLLHEIIFNLNTNMRQAAILRFFEDKDYEEISDILCKPIGTVSTLISRAKNEIIIELKKRKAI